MDSVPRRSTRSAAYKLTVAMTTLLVVNYNIIMSITYSAKAAESPAESISKAILSVNMVKKNTKRNNSGRSQALLFSFAAKSTWCFKY